MAVQKTTLPPFVIDAGNAFVKYVVGSIESTFVHKVALLMPGEYQDALERYGKAAYHDFLQIDGQSYVIGTTAENYHVQRREGAPKYERTYYGVLFASAIGRAFASNPALLKNGIQVIASHASKDYRFYKTLVSSIKGRWKFEFGGQKFDFTVTDVKTYEEPFGSYARCAFTKDSRRRWQTPLHGMTVGVMDIGGGTSGVLQVDESGNVRYGQSDSGEIGMNSVVSNLADLLKSDFPEKFGRVKAISPNRLRRAIMTGVYSGGGETVPCERQVEMACAPLLNEVENMYLNRMGGGDDIDMLILTGGGNAVLWERVKGLLGHGNTILADDTSEIQFANVRGAKTFYEVLEEVL